ncbi:hypothetical protein BDR06DRAFT_972294 [Suillus hirtellus]|nr:hypothetical protein BDR06DRAFT_972294 [Suillus hirtellus]
MTLLNTSLANMWCMHLQDDHRSPSHFADFITYGELGQDNAPYACLLMPILILSIFQMMEKGINPAHKDSILSQYPPNSQIHFDRLTVVCDKFSIIVLWYLLGTIDLAIKNDMAAATAIIIDFARLPATLRLFDGRSCCQAMQRLVVLIATALRVIHPNLYWSLLAMKLVLGLWTANKKLDEMGDCLREWASIFTALAIICIESIYPMVTKQPGSGI